jgi:glutathione synthase/RimK-type ligase-like ATP-grasp enzyme
VDCVETPAGPVVIEVNDFPNYTGVPGADDALARLVLARGAALPLGRIAS